MSSVHDPCQEAPSTASRSLRECPACAGAASPRLHGVKGAFRWRLCASCATTYVDRTPAAEELAAVYDGYYGAQNLVVPDFVSRRLGEIIGPFAHYRSSGRLLDVGFGAGVLLAKADEMGWECWGQEISPEPLRVARERGWRVIEGDLCAAQLPDGHFDVICIAEVVEHLPNPADYLRASYRLLRPGGLLYVTTPNGRSLTARLLGVDWSVYSAPEHLQLFSRQSLARALRQVGFTAVRTATEGLNPAELLAKWNRSPGTVDRVQTAYALNQRMSSGTFPRLAKRVINRLLTLTRLGESIKCWAERPATDVVVVPAR